MIFVTVGTQLPFDRLVSAVAAWHRKHADHEIFAQVGASTAAPPFPSVPFLDGPAFARTFDKADLVVSHAGIGTVLACWAREKPLVVMPRAHALGEHRTDHQIATVNRLGEELSLAAARDSEQLARLLNTAWSQLIPRRTLPPVSGERISDRINDWLKAPQP
ncbi:UDP-N-acetylglucosamine transferase subunit ALG13 [Limimonas halophila]|uniref:UDP-N-acetylglucosamine transferase subunit ALG13 n=1 Tax=Limimonas halophila TaxID=1082479 RepID=A0A1G7NLK6_9PROT|nr:glycosyltransferase [Limimonas halophila]SDF74964.1 UDP-N-acetylglucosamine transferase subunit ALG13 [Limimonas halophila]